MTLIDNFIVMRIDPDDDEVRLMASFYRLRWGSDTYVDDAMALKPTESMY